MKQLISKMLMVAAVLSVSANALAYEFQVGGICYEIFSSTIVKVVRRSGNFYSGNVRIPEQVSYDNITYNVRYIDSYAFAYCNNLTSLTIPNSIISIENGSFVGCENLKELIIKDGKSPLSLGYQSLNGAGLFYISPLETVYLGRNLSYSVSPFSNKPIKNLTIGENVTTIGSSAFRGCSSLTSVTIPNSVTSIGNSAFSGCSSLASVTIPNSVTTIGDYAFSGCGSLTSVTIPNSVTKIGSFAFSGCGSIEKVISLNPAPPETPSSVFDDSVKYKAILYVPKGSLKAYLMVAGWFDFLIIELENGDVSSLEGDAINVTTKDDRIVVEDAGGSVVEVYNSGGQLIYVGTDSEIEIPAKGIYIVRVSGRTFKIAVL